LEVCAKTPEELEAEIEYKKRRLQMAAIRDTLPTLRAEAEKLQEAWQTEAVRWTKLVDEHNQIIRPLAARAEALANETGQAAGMSSQLRHTYRGPLLDRLQDIENRRAALHLRKVSLADLRGQHERFVQNGEHTNAGASGGKYHVNPEEIEARRRAAAQYQAEIEALQQQVAELDREYEATEAAMSEP
jgi:uncharacterized protein YukE